MNTALYIFAAAVGGFFGAGARYLMTRCLCNLFKVSAPNSLLIINLIGTFVLGTIFGDYSHVKDNFEFVLLTVGFCGSFTTFSTFARQLVDFWHRERKGILLFYWGINLLFGVLAFTGGIFIRELLNKNII